MANAIARKAMAQSVTSSSLAASGWNQVYGNGAPQGAVTKVSDGVIWRGHISSRLSECIEGYLLMNLYVSRSFSLSHSNPFDKT